MPTQDWIIAAIVALTPVVTNILVWVVQKYDVTVPAWIKQFLTLGLSALATYVGGLAVANPVAAALLAFAAVALHAIVNELSKATGLKALFFPKY